MIKRVYMCKYCGKQYKSGQSLGGHTTRCSKNPNSKQCNDRMVKSRTHIRNYFSFNCCKCGVQYKLKLSENMYNRGIYTKYCSRACANSRTWTEQDKLKKSISAKSSLLVKNIIRPGRHKKVTTKSKIEPKKKQITYNCCQSCGIKTRNRHFCSVDCYKLYHTTKRGKYNNYVIECRFKFNVWDYPEWFNVDLIKQHGIYKASNRGNNLAGISRDHMYSVSQGFANDISPQLISHPANCELMIHKINNKKNTKSSLSLQQLKERIKEFQRRFSKVG